MIVIGLTGGIGTGKTQVSRILRGLGAEVINADLVGHEAYEPDSEAWHEVVDAFGQGVLAASREVDRRKLGAIVFSNPEALKRLNAIMHPRMYEMIRERIEGLRKQETDVTVVEAALLLEANWTSLVDEVWVTTSTEEQVLQRLRANYNLDEKAIRARVQSQQPQAELERAADVVIDNSGDLAQLRDQVEALWNSRVLAHQENVESK